MEVPKPKRYSNPRYLDYVRGLPCASCGRIGPSDPHHISWVEGTRAGGKADDSYVLPLCRLCHQLEHEQYGMEKLEIATAMLRALKGYLERVDP